jgi:hypothetical protein
LKNADRFGLSRAWSKSCPLLRTAAAISSGDLESRTEKLMTFFA